MRSDVEREYQASQDCVQQIGSHGGLPQEDLAKDIKYLDLPHLQTSIGIGWDIEADTLLIRKSPNM